MSAIAKKAVVKSIRRSPKRTLRRTPEKPEARAEGMRFRGSNNVISLSLRFGPLSRGDAVRPREAERGGTKQRKRACASKPEAQAEGMRVAARTRPAISAAGEV